MLKPVTFGRHIRDYWVNPTFQQMKDNTGLHMIEGLSRKPEKCYEYYRITADTHLQSIIMKKVLDKLYTTL
jgi:uncharacterized membrane protein YdbT with pleckstrin-like domain